MFNFLPAVADPASQARFNKALAWAETGVVTKRGSTSSHVSNRLTWNRSHEFTLEALPEHGCLPAIKNIQLCDGGVWGGGMALMRGEKNDQRCKYSRDSQ